MFTNTLRTFNRKTALTKGLSQRLTKPKTLLKPAPMATFSNLANEKVDPKWENARVLVTGCQGQIGVPLVRALCKELGADKVVATDVSEQRFDFDCAYERLCVADTEGYMSMMKRHKVNYIVHLAGILSALGEKNPDLAIDVNAIGVINAIRAAQETNS